MESLPNLKSTAILKLEKMIEKESKNSFLGNKSKNNFVNGNPAINGANNINNEEMIKTNDEQIKNINKEENKQRIIQIYYFR